MAVEPSTENAREDNRFEDAKGDASRCVDVLCWDGIEDA